MQVRLLTWTGRSWKSSLAGIFLAVGSLWLAACLERSAAPEVPFDAGPGPCATQTPCTAHFRCPGDAGCWYVSRCTEQPLVCASFSTACALQCGTGCCVPGVLLRFEPPLLHPVCHCESKDAR